MKFLTFWGHYISFGYRLFWTYNSLRHPGIMAFFIKFNKLLL